MMKFQVPATVSKITTMADKSLRIQVDTQELNKEEKAMVFDLHEEIGWFVFSKSTLTEKDLNLPEIRLDEFDKKTPSQRLRDRLFVFYDSTHSDKSGFNEWYLREMDKIGQHYLNKKL